MGGRRPLRLEETWQRVLLWGAVVVVLVWLGIMALLVWDVVRTEQEGFPGQEWEGLSSPPSSSNATSST
jgi:hypothetical protein